MNHIMAKSTTRLREYDTVHCHGSRIARKVFFLEDEERNDFMAMSRSENIGQSYILTLESASPTGHTCVNNLELKLLGNAVSDAPEKVWNWCVVLIFSILSDNFDLVIAEALERGKRVITTDGAPAWGDGNDYGGRLIYLKGYRDGSDNLRVNLLKAAIATMSESLHKNRYTF